MWWLWMALAWGVPKPASDAVAMGDCKRALEQIPQPDQDDERLITGYCLQKLGDSTAAAAALANVGDGVLGDYARFVRAHALADLQRPSEALAVMEGLKLPGDAGLELRLLRARLLIESDHSLEAREDLRALLDTEVKDEARYWLCIGAERRGDMAAAIPTWRRLWAESVTGPWSKKAAEHLEKLGSPVPDLSTSEGRALVRDRVAALRKNNQHTEALARLDQLAAVEPPTTRSAKLELARARFDARDYAGARSGYEAALGAPDRCTGSSTDLFEYALSTARSGDYDAAAVIYKRVDSQHPETSDADFASFKLGYMKFDKGDWKAAREEFAAHIRRRPSSKHLDEAWWFSARAAWKLGDTAAMGKDLDALIAQRPKSSLAPAAAYWRARAKGLAGDAAGEKTAMEGVISDYPVSGHAWLAAKKLQRRFPKQPRVERPAWPASLASRTDVKRGDALLALGFKSWARAELASIQTAATSSGKDGSLAAAHALIAAGDYVGGQALASKYCVSPWKGGDPVAQQACTPMPEESIVFATAAPYALDPLVPFGIMTAESSLKPEVTSIAGARGLMQVRPEEAERIHKEVFGDSPFDPDDLYRAPYNAALGTAELGMKNESLKGTLSDDSLPAVIASYNGGETAVRRWLAAFEQPPPADEFSEDVGYTETRQYVRRVLGFVMAYRWVYGDP